MGRRLTKTALLAVIATTIGCDQVTKHAAAEHLMGLEPQSFLADSMRLEYAENTGAFLSLGEHLPHWARVAVLSVGTAILLAGCVVVALRRNWPRVPQFGMALIFAGGVSNLADRIARGSVIDFMNVGIGGLRTGIFNVADMAILLGAALLFFQRRSRHVGGPEAA